MPAIVALSICDVLVTLNAFIAQGEVESLARLCLACKTLYDPVSLWELRTEAEIHWHDCEVWFEWYMEVCHYQEVSRYVNSMYAHELTYAYELGYGSD